MRISFDQSPKPSPKGGPGVINRSLFTTHQSLFESLSSHQHVHSRRSTRDILLPILIKVPLPPKPTRTTVGIIFTCDYKHVIYTLPESVVKERILNNLDKETLISFYSQTTIPPPNLDHTRGNWDMIS